MVNCHIERSLIMLLCIYWDRWKIKCLKLREIWYSMKCIVSSSNSSSSSTTWWMKQHANCKRSINHNGKDAANLPRQENRQNMPCRWVLNTYLEFGDCITPNLNPKSAFISISKLCESGINQTFRTYKESFCVAKAPISGSYWLKNSILLKACLC